MRSYGFVLTAYTYTTVLPRAQFRSAAATAALALAAARRTRQAMRKRRLGDGAELSLPVAHSGPKAHAKRSGRLKGAFEACGQPSAAVLRGLLRACVAELREHTLSGPRRTVTSHRSRSLKASPIAVRWRMPGAESRDHDTDTNTDWVRPLPRMLSRRLAAVARILVNDSHESRVESGAGREAILTAWNSSLDRMPWQQALSDATTAGSGTFVWLDMLEPSVAALNEVADVLGLPAQAVIDAMSDLRPKIESHGEVIFGVLRTVRYLEPGAAERTEIIESGTVVLFLGERFVLTIRHGIDVSLQEVLADLRSQPELLMRGPWAVAYAIYDCVVDTYVECSVRIRGDIETLEAGVFGGLDKVGVPAQRIYQLKRELLEFRGAVVPLQIPIEKIVSRDLAEIPAEIRRIFRDVLDHLTRTVEQVHYFDDVTNSILQANLIMVDVSQNSDMRRIAAWGALLAVWGIIVGVYQMSGDFPVLHERYPSQTFGVAIAVGITISIVLYRNFRRIGWL